MRLEENSLPLTITIPVRHEHILNGKRVTYDVVELKTNDPNYHGHGAALNAISEPNTRLFTSTDTTLFMGPFKDVLDSNNLNFGQGPK